MDGKFTEQDSIRIADAARDNITGEMHDSGTVDYLSVCPLLTAGFIANPNYTRGGVACLREACALWDMDSANENSRECLLYLAGFDTSVSAEYIKEIRDLLRRNL